MSLHDEWPLINIIMPLRLRLSRAAQYAYVLAGWLVYCVALFLFFFLLRTNPVYTSFILFPASTSRYKFKRRLTRQDSSAATHKRQDLHLRKVITPAIFCRHVELWRPCHKRNGSKRWLFVCLERAAEGTERNGQVFNLRRRTRVRCPKKKAISEARLK